MDFIKTSSLSAQIRKLANHAALLESAMPIRKSPRMHFKGRNIGFRFALVSTLREIRSARVKYQQRAYYWWAKKDPVNFHYFEGVVAALTEVIGVHALWLKKRRAKSD
jgi:hypothetical protein